MQFEITTPSFVYTSNVKENVVHFCNLGILPISLCFFKCCISFDDRIKNGINVGACTWHT